MTGVGYNDLVKLRSSLSGIEKNKMEIDDDIAELQKEASTLVENRDNRIPELKRLRAELEDETPKIKQKISDKENEIDVAKQGKITFDESNNIIDIKNTLAILEEECSSLRDLHYNKIERNKWIYGAIFAIILGAILTYAAYEYVPSTDDKKHTCPDGDTIVSHNQLMDGTKDCPNGWDESDDWLDTEDAESVRVDDEFTVTMWWILAVALIIGGVYGGAVSGEPFATFLDDKSGYGRKRGIALSKKLRHELDNRQILSNSGNMLNEINDKEKYLYKLNEELKTIELKLEKLNSVDITNLKVNQSQDQFSRRDKPWMCPVCVKNFKTRQAVMSHMKAKGHDGEPYKIPDSSVSQPESGSKNIKLKEDDSIPYLENEVDKQRISISKRIDIVRSKSNKIVDTFNQIKHLIPNSDSINPTSSDLEEILAEISGCIKAGYANEGTDLQQGTNVVSNNEFSLDLEDLLIENTETVVTQDLEENVGMQPQYNKVGITDLDTFPQIEQKGFLDDNGYEWIKHAEKMYYRLPNTNSQWTLYES